MSTPNLGASWVFLLVSVSPATCAYGCAYYCAYCVGVGTHNSCTRSAVLTLPQ
jgi:hypothetical protein